MRVVSRYSLITTRSGERYGRWKTVIHRWFKTKAKPVFSARIISDDKLGRSEEEDSGKVGKWESGLRLLHRSARRKYESL